MVCSDNLLLLKTRNYYQKGRLEEKDFKCYQKEWGCIDLYWRTDGGGN